MNLTCWMLPKFVNTIRNHLLFYPHSLLIKNVKDICTYFNSHIILSLLINDVKEEKNKMVQGWNIRKRFCANETVICLQNINNFHISFGFGKGKVAFEDRLWLNSFISKSGDENLWIHKKKTTIMVFILISRAM